MFALDRAAKPACNKKIVASLAASARYPAIFLNESSNARGNDGWPGCAAHFTANDADIKTRRRPVQAAIKFHHPVASYLFRDDECYQSKLRHSGCRGKVTEGTHHRFPPDVDGIGRRQKVDAFDHAISFKNKKVAAGRAFHYCAVVAGARDNRSRMRKARQESGEQPVFAQRLQFHCRKISGNARTVSESELKSECIVIETRMEPLHS